MSKYDDLIDMSQVDPPLLVEEIGYDEELAHLIAKYKELWPEFEDETEFEPVRAHLGVDADLADNFRTRVNVAGKATLLASASGTDLNVLGWARSVERKVIDEEAGVFETDADFRSRIQMAPESWSTAGPRGAYEFWAEAVEGVRDAHADSPSPAVIEIHVIGHDTSQAASNALIADVLAAVTKENRLPVADRVSVLSAEVVSFDVDATLKLLPGPSAEVVEQNARASLEAYLSERSYIGKSIPESGLHAALSVAGVDSVSLTPAGVAITKTQIAHCASITLQVELIDD